MFVSAFGWVVSANRLLKNEYMVAMLAIWAWKPKLTAWLPATRY